MGSKERCNGIFQAAKMICISKVSQFTGENVKKEAYSLD